MASPRVSICVPTWNGATFLGEALQSAVAQTYEDFELLVVDDCSRDRTSDVADACRDPRITLHRNDRRLGIPGNWNRCLELARGTYVKFLFQDDILAPSALAELVMALEKVPEATLAFTRREIRHEDGDGTSLPLLDGPYTETLASFYAWMQEKAGGLELVVSALRDGRDLTINVIGEPSFVLLRRDVAIGVGGFDPRFTQLVDWDLWLRLGRHGPLVFVNDSLGVFRVHGSAYSAKNHRRMRVRWEFLRLLDRVMSEYGSDLVQDDRQRLIDVRWRYRRHLIGEAVRRALPASWS